MKRILLYLLLLTSSLSIIARPVGCPNVSAGPDQTVCRHGVATLAAHGGSGTWTSLSTNRDTLVFTNPSDSSTTVRGFNGTGTDTLVWTANGCSDTMLITIGPNGGPERFICASFPGGSVTMAATGAGRWNPVSTNPGTSKIVDTLSATTVIDSFSAAGVYNYVWITATCRDTVSVIVTHKPNAGIDQTICRYATVNLAAHGGGRGSWFTMSTNLDTITFANQNDSLTTARGFGGRGVDALIWISDGCPDTLLITTLPNGGPNKAVNCAVLPGGTATMAATGTGTWTAATGNPGTSTITTPTSPTTTITTYSAAGTYRYIWTTATCHDTVSVVVTGKPNAGIDQTICQFNTTTLAATGTGMWTYAPGNPDLVSFTNPTSPTTPVANFSSSGVYTLYWTLNGCNDTMLIHVTPRPNGGPDQTTCQYSSATMAAVGSGTWTAVAGNPATTVIVTPTSTSTVINGFSVAGTYKFLWTQNSCPDTVQVIVTPKPSAGPDQTICQRSTATMAGVGTGTWSQVPNNPSVTAITTPSSATTTITNFDSFGVYNFVWSVNGCTDTVAITVTTAGPDTIVYCYSTGTAHLHATGTGVWSIASGNPGTSTITNPNSGNALVTNFSDSGVFYYVWTAGGCTDTAKVTAVHTCPPTNDNVNTPQVLGRLPSPSGGCGRGATVTIPGTNIGATPSVPYPYQGSCLVNSNSYPNDVWYTFHPTGFTTVINITSTFPNPMIDVWQGTPGNLIGLGCTIGSGGTASLILFNLDTTLTYYIQVAGSNANQNGTFTMTARDSIDCTGCFHSGFITATPAPQNNSYSPGQTVQVCYTVVDYIQYQVNWFHGLQPSFGPGWDTSTITVVSTAPACEAAGSWGWYPNGVVATRGTNANIPYPKGWYFNNPSPNGTGGPGNNYGDDCASHTWVFCLDITAKPTCSPGIDMSLTFNTSGDGESGGWGSFGCSNDHAVTQYAVGSCCPPTLSGTDPTCGNNNGLVTATPTSGAGPWTYSWVDSALNFHYTQSNVHGTDTVKGLAPGTYTLLTLDSLNCPANGSVTIRDTTSANAGPDQSICQFTTATMAGTSLGASIWTALSTNPSPTTITTPTSHTTSISGFIDTGTYKFVLTSGPCTDTMSVFVVAKPNAGPDQTICQYSPATMAALNPIGVWSALTTNPSVTTIDTPSFNRTNISNLIDTGVYKFVWTAGGCTDTMAVHVVPQSNAGPDKYVNCAILPGGSDTMAAVGTGTWTAVAGNPGTATIVSPTNPLSPITNFSAAGTYNFIWTTAGGCVDTASVFVTAKPSAGSAQTVTCYPADSIATMAATGTGIWTPEAYNPGTAVIVDSALPHTIITSFSTAGTYYFIWTNASGCADTSSVFVTSKPNAGPDQTLTCAILPGGVVTMAATGTGTWLPQSNNPGTAVITSPTSPTTTIDSFSISGTYNFIWSNGSCSDTATVNVTSLSTAGGTHTYNCVVLPIVDTLRGGGPGVWSALPTNPGAAVITSPNNPVTSITNINVSGTYKFVLTHGSCTDTATIVVTGKPNAGPDQVVTCYPMTSTATMAGTGTGIWTAQAGNPGTATITTPTSPTTTITNYSAAGLYYFIWTNGPCSDTATVSVTTKPNAGPDQTVTCASLTGGSATMAATGTGTWSAMATNPGTATITNPTSPVTTITNYTAPGTYSFIWTASVCSDTANVVVTAKPNAGLDQTVNCAVLPGGTATMGATATGTWSAQAGNPGTATITLPTNPTTTITNYSAPGTYYFIWTNASGCKDTASVVVTAKPNAGTDKIVTCVPLPGGSATMSGTGTGTWSAMTGNPGTATITSPTLATTTITGFTASGTYFFIFTNASGCTDTASIAVTAKPNAGADQTVTCAVLPGGTATMSATGAGTWTAAAGNPGTAVITNPTLNTTTITTYSAPGTYLFIWTNSDGCTDTANVVVTAKPNAGTDQTVVCASLPGGSATMTGSGTGTWTAQTGNPGTAVITNPSISTTTITTYSAPGTYFFIWTNASGCTDTAAVVVTAKPNAGADQIVSCASLPGGTATMTGTGAGTWTQMAGAPGTSVITNPTLATTTITTFSAAGTYTYIWTNASGCSDTASIVVTAKPNAGPDQTVTCAVLPGGSATMAATGAGTWSAQAGNPGTAVITTPTNINTTITTYSAPGTYYFIWTNASGCTDTAAVVVTAKPNAGLDQTVLCAALPGGSATMNGSGLGTWSAMTGNPGTATITTPTSPTTTITTFSASGTYSFIFTNASGCTDTASIVVTAKPNAGPDQTVTCAVLPGGSATMAATGAGTWSTPAGNPGTATITSTTTNNTTITTFSAPGTYHFIWTNSDGCTDTANVVVTAKPNAGPDQSVLCALLPGGTATMAGTGTGTWTAQAGNPGPATITSPTSSTTTITSFLTPGTYGFIWTNASGCTDTALVTVTQEPTITLPNYSYCLGGSATLTPAAAPAGGTYLWNTSAATPTISVNVTTTTSFTATYTLGSCSASAVDTVTVYTLPLATVTTIPSVCTANNGIAIANPSAGTPGYTYSWGTPPGGTGDSITNVAPGTYTVTVTDAHHCTVAASGTVGLQTPAIIVTEVSQHDLKCFNDNTGEIFISTTDTARNSGPYVNTYNWSNATHNQNLTGAPAGTFTVNVTDQFGCTGSGTYTLTQPVALSATTSFVNPHCFGYADGTATVVNPAGGSGAYHYAWSTTPVQNTQTATGLTANTYTVALSDDSACVLTLTVTLTDPLQITFGDSTIVNPSCFGDSNGTALVAPQNGIGTYTYAWSYGGQTLNPAINLPNGTDSVVVTDGNGCHNTAYVTITQPQPVTVTATTVEVTCFGSSNGSATATASGGTAPYAYRWNTADSTATAPNLVAGSYTVTATDNHGCTATTSTTVAQPTKVQLSVTSVRTNCTYTSDGTITATGTGGTGSYTYTLEDSNGNVLVSGNTSGNFTGLAYGPYIVVVQDQNNCPAAEPIVVPRAPVNFYTFTADTVSCYGPQYHDGIIHVQGYTIPNGPFTYSVDGSAFQSIPDFFDLAAGPHQVTAQDHYGCDTTFTVTVGEPLPAVLEILPGDSTITPGTALQLSTSFGPYPLSSVTSYQWTPVNGLNCSDCSGPIASPYDPQNDYTLVVTYNKGCTVSATIRINVHGTPPIFIPNAFSPNGDGVDDVWTVFGTGIKDFKGTVYNRWGEKVYESDNQSDGWDGTYKGALQPPGIYVYLVDVVYLSGEKLTKQGSITLIR